MSAITVPHAGRCRHDAPVNIWFMTGEGSKRHRRGRYGHGRGGFGGGPFFGPGRRAGRGDIRAAILTLLAEEPMHGYQVIQVISERSGGNWTPSPGSVYPDAPATRGRGPDRGGRLRIRAARLRAHRRRSRGSRREGPAVPWEAAAETLDDDLVELRELVHQVLAATRQVAQAGSAAQIKGAQDVLRAARKGIYKLLAEDD